MLVSDRIIFVELQKTGCTHIHSLLAQIVGGKRVGKHNRPGAETLASGYTFIGSIRNPWDWYISLWAYGCDGRGKLFHRLTKVRWSLSLSSWWHPRRTFATISRDMHRQPARWRQCYRSSKDAGAFREWLWMIHDEMHRNELDEGYGSSQMSQYAGLLTFRYILLFCREGDLAGDMHRVPNVSELQEQEHTNCYIDHFIRNECLEGDLVAALKASSVPLNDSRRDLLYSQKRTNTSSRRRSTDYYYDEATSRLIADRDKLIIDRFCYSPPHT